MTVQENFSRSVFRFAALQLCLCCVLGIAKPVLAQQPLTLEKQAKVVALNAEMNQAMDKVRAIINQPVTRLPRKPGMQVRISSPGWFHEGANKPSFGHVDVRKSQQFPYTQSHYITSDLNPGYVFISSQLEFNSMTKYFYTDRSLPKK